MRRKLIAAIGLLSVGGAVAAVLALSGPAASAHTAVDAAGCRLTDSGRTVCNGYK